MRRNRLFLAIALTLTSPALADGLPKEVGQCSLTRVKKVETRLVDSVTNQPVLGSGSAIEFTNGVSQVSYQIPGVLPTGESLRQEKALHRSRPGHLVRICLVAVPNDCPPGDERGRMYWTKNLRTRSSWTLPNSEHMCGGA